MKSLVFSISLFFVSVSFLSAQKEGDTKYSYATEDHTGWYKLDGRPLTTLPAEAQQAATRLGYIGTLPNATDRLLKTSSTVPFRAVGGANMRSILQANLPNVTLNGSTSSNGQHSHIVSGTDNSATALGPNGEVSNLYNGSGGPSTINTGLEGTHNHTITTSSLNGNVTQIPLNTENAFININTFVYLKPTTQLGNLSEVITTPFVVASDATGTLSRISVANLAKPVVTTTPAAGSDSDWFSTITNSPSTNIQNDIYTMGKVGIGTKNPDTRLTVKGIVHAEEVKVDLDVPADYVFQKYFTGHSALKPNYEMPDLGAVESYIKQNHHLPRIPSAQEIKEKGMELGKMNNLLLEKVEELTLYAIEQQKQINQQEEQMKNQAQMIERLNQRLGQLEKAKP